MSGDLGAQFWQLRRRSWSVATLLKGFVGRSGMVPLVGGGVANGEWRYISVSSLVVVPITTGHCRHSQSAGSTIWVRMKMRGSAPIFDQSTGTGEMKEGHT